MKNRTSLDTDLLSMNISWSYEDLELLENNYDFAISLVFTMVRTITLILGIIVHRAFYKLMKRLPGRAINQIIYPYMVIHLRSLAAAHSQIEHYFFSYLLTCEVYLIEVMEILAHMLQYIIFLSLKAIKVSSDFILNYLRKVVGGATIQKYQKQMLKP